MLVITKLVVSGTRNLVRKETSIFLEQQWRNQPVSSRTFCLETELKISSSWLCCLVSKVICRRSNTVISRNLRVLWLSQVLHQREKKREIKKKKTLLTLSLILTPRSQESLLTTDLVIDTMEKTETTFTHPTKYDSHVHKFILIYTREVICPVQRDTLWVYFYFLQNKPQKTKQGHWFIPLT